MHIKCCCFCIYVFEKEKGKIILFYEIKSEKVFSLFSNKFDKCRDIWRFQYFLEILIFFGIPKAQKNPPTFFSLKIKSSENQKCGNKLFLSKSKIL